MKFLILPIFLRSSSQVENNVYDGQLFPEKMREKSTVGILNKYETGSYRLNTKITDENSVK